MRTAIRLCAAQRIRERWSRLAYAWRRLYHGEGRSAVQGILGQLAARCGDYSRASELLGQSQALLAELDDSELTGYAHFEYLLFVCIPRGDAVLAALRSRTGAAAFDKAQAWGRSTGRRRAVEYALA